MLEFLSSVLPAILTLTGVGLFFGILLSIAKLKLYVEKDPRVDLIADVLPGANCGACGFPGCGGYARKIVLENCEVSLCPVGGAETAEKIAKIMGIDFSGTMTSLTARVHCQGGNLATTKRFLYSGPKSCYAANITMDGPKTCSFGCLGLGDCVKVCLFDAITMSDEGLPVVDQDKCTGCNQCVLECPRGIISLAPASIEPVVLCKNTEKMSLMKKGCSVGCTGCKLCEKNCPEGAISVVNFCAIIDYDKCTNCMKCVEVCIVPVISPIEKSKKYLKQQEEALKPKAEVLVSKESLSSSQDEAH